MKEQLISFKTAKLAKEKGFFIITPDYYACENPLSESCKELKKLSWSSAEIWYTKEEQKDEESGLLLYQLNPGCVFAPRQSELQKWLREEHGLDVFCMPISDDSYRWYNNVASHNPVITGTYEEVLEIGLFELLKEIKI